MSTTLKKPKYLEETDLTITPSIQAQYQDAWNQTKAINNPTLDIYNQYTKAATSLKPKTVTANAPKVKTPTQMYVNAPVQTVAPTSGVRLSNTVNGTGVGTSQDDIAKVIGTQKEWQDLYDSMVGGEKVLTESGDTLSSDGNDGSAPVLVEEEVVVSDDKGEGSGEGSSEGSVGGSKEKSSNVVGYENLMESLSAKYGGNILSFDVSTLSPEDERRYYNDLNTYLAMQSAVNTYNENLKKTQEEAIRQENEAITRRRLMEKYIPETLAAMGLEGNALTSDALLRMNTAYDNFLANTRANQTSEEQRLFKDYQDALTSAKTKHNENRVTELNEEIKTNKAKEEVQNKNFEQIRLEIDNSPVSVDWKTAEYLVRIGELTQEQLDTLKQESYDKIKTYLNIDESSSFDVDDVDVKWLNKDADGGTYGETSKQNAYAQNIINLARQGRIPDGTVINMNYGYNKVDPHYVVYYNGRFYKRMSKGSVGLVNYGSTIVTSDNYKDLFGLA